MAFVVLVDYNSMKQLFLLALFIFSVNWSRAQAGTDPVQPYEVVTAFINALGERHFADAYNKCIGTRWGTLAQFSSMQMYGGITGATIISIDSAKSTGGTDVAVKAVSKMEDPVNGSGIFTQNFVLKKQPDNRWKISSIKLLASTRAQDNWNLKLSSQPDFTLRDVQRLTKPVYDTLKTQPVSADNMERSVKTLIFYKTDKDTFAIAVAENKDMTGCGICIGWCDVSAFQKINGRWQMTGFLSGAGGGNLGNSGHFERLIRVGDDMLGIVVSGGLFHSGALIFDDIISCSGGKLTRLVSVFTSHEYNGGTYYTQEEVDYQFKKNGKPMYDLIIERYNTEGKTRKKTDSVVLPYKNGYELPERFKIDG